MTTESQFFLNFIKTFYKLNSFDKTINQSSKKSSAGGGNTSSIYDWLVKTILLGNKPGAALVSDYHLSNVLLLYKFYQNHNKTNLDFPAFSSDTVGL